MTVSVLAAEAWVHRHARKGKAYGNYFGYYRFPDEPPANRRRVNLGTRDKRVAEQKLRRIIEDDHAVREGLKPAPQVIEESQRPLGEHLKRFLADKESRGLSRDYVRKLRQRLPKLFDACGWTRAADITRASFLEWRASVKGCGPKTKNDYLDHASGFCGWLVELGVLASNPLAGIPKAKVAGNQTRPRRPLTEAEAQRLVRCTPCQRRKLLYRLALLTGGREGELLDLQ